MSRVTTPTDDLAIALSESLDKTQLDRVIAEAGRSRVPAQLFHFAGGWLTPPAYTKALARHHGTAVAARPGDTGPDELLIDATSHTPAATRAALAAACRAGHNPVLLTGAAAHSFAPDEEATTRTITEAIDALRTSAPVQSAGRRMWLWQYIAGALTLGAALGITLTAPVAAGTGVLFATALVFAGVTAFRVLVLMATLARARRHYARAAPALDADDLPTYSVLVPLYREAAIVPDLIDALAALDYPRAKLDIVLILEECDKATRAAVARTGLPPYVRCIVVPDRQPRTKPKALNMALALSHGDFVAVFDAEDIPAPDQLLKAAAAFAAAPGRYACLQARLAIHNPRQSWLSRQFAIEYATLFHAFLPALIRLGLPLPLSGTSNHFPRAVLREVAAWDPFNVTEDADLGIRITRAGGRIGLLDCDTYEEAPPTLRQWLPQRTRWIKGWMQTYLVHTRQPWRLLRQLGVWRTVGFHAIFAGFLISALAYPLMCIAVGIELSRPVPFAMEPGSLRHGAFVLALIDLATAVLATLLTGLMGTARAGLGALAGHLLAAPLYWLLISAAGYRALGQIIRRPHLWEKTEHAPRRRGRRRLAQR